MGVYYCSKDEVDTIGIDRAVADCLGDIRCSWSASHYGADIPVHLRIFKISQF